MGRGTREEVVRHDQCPGLLEAGLTEFAFVAAGAFYAVARPEFPLVIVVVCNGGSGRVLVGRESYVLAAGQSLLIPAGPAHEFRSNESGWEYTQFWYLPTRLNVPEVAVVRLHSLPLTSLVRALLHENHADADETVQRQLVGLIDGKLRRLANPVARADLLGPVWAEVARRPQEAWDLDKLAALAAMSTEHLRRLARRETGRTPMEQVTWLRVQRAATLLATTNDVVEQIAEQVGYGGVRAFRAAFLRHLGRTPKAHRDETRRAFTARADRGGALVPHLAAAKILPAGEGRETLYAGVRAVKGWRSLNLGDAINTAFASGERPWFGQPLLHVRAGVKLIHGVPFTVRREGCVLLRSARLGEAANGEPLPDTIRMAVPRLVRRAYFLHACGWGSRPGPFASYRWVGADGTAEEISLATLGIGHPEEPEGRAANIQDWYFAYDHVTRPQARPYDLKPRSDPTATSQFLYTLEWMNPHPERPLASLEIRSNAGLDATLGVLAITVEPERAKPRK